MIYKLGTEKDSCCAPVECCDKYSKVYYPTLYLDSSQFPPVKGLKLGDRIKMTVFGVVTSGSDTLNEDGKFMNRGIELHEATLGKDSDDDITKAVKLLKE
jgi:hypothetical protein